MLLHRLHWLAPESYNSSARNDTFLPNRQAPGSRGRDSAFFASMWSQSIDSLTGAGLTKGSGPFSRLRRGLWLYMNRELIFTHIYDMVPCRSRARAAKVLALRRKVFRG